MTLTTAAVLRGGIDPTHLHVPWMTFVLSWPIVVVDTMAHAISAAVAIRIFTARLFVRVDVLFGSMITLRKTLSQAAKGGAVSSS